MGVFRRMDLHKVYVPEIDAEHRSLFRLAEQLHEAVQSGTDKTRVRAGLRSLYFHADEHFMHEERMMRTMRFPGYDWHKRQHETARKKIRHAARAYERGATSEVTRSLEGVAAWLRDHSGIADRMLGAYFRNFERLQGSKPS